MSKPRKGNKPKSNKGKPNKPKPPQGQTGKQAQGTAKAPRQAASAPAAEAQAHQGERKLTRDERWELARKAQRRKSLIRRVVIGLVIAALVGGVLAWQIGKRRDESKAIAAMTAGSCNFDRKSDEGDVNEHAPNPTFRLEPPSGGVHTPNVASPGDFLTATPPPDGQLVHALEHGDIVIWVRPDVSEEDIATLRDIHNDHENDVLLVSRPQLPVPIAATTWHKRLLCDRLEEQPIRRFIERWHDKGPEGQTD